MPERFHKIFHVYPINVIKSSLIPLDVVHNVVHNRDILYSRPVQKILPNRQTSTPIDPTMYPEPDTNDMIVS